MEIALNVICLFAALVVGTSNKTVKEEPVTERNEEQGNP